MRIHCVAGVCRFHQALPALPLRLPLRTADLQTAVHGSPPRNTHVKHLRDAFRTWVAYSWLHFTDVGYTACVHGTPSTVQESASHSPSGLETVESRVHCAVKLSKNGLHSSCSEHRCPRVRGQEASHHAIFPRLGGSTTLSFRLRGCVHTAWGLLRGFGVGNYALFLSSVGYVAPAVATG